MRCMSICRLMADSVKKVFFGRRMKILKTADASRARRCEGPHRFTHKRPGTLVSAPWRVVEIQTSKKSTFARFLASFDLRLLQQYQLLSDASEPDNAKQLPPYRLPGVKRTCSALVVTSDSDPPLMLPTSTHPQSVAGSRSCRGQTQRWSSRSREYPRIFRFRRCIE